MLQRLSPLLPLLSAAFAVLVIGRCVELAKLHAHVPPHVRFPPISLAGIEAPEYFTFAPGFVCIALLLAANERLFWAFFERHLAAPAAWGRQELALQQTRHVVRLGFLGLAVTGVVPLQGWGELATSAHLLGAMAFFMCSLRHGHVLITSLSSEALSYHPMHAERRPWLWRAKVAMLSNGFLSFLPAQLLHPGGTPQRPHLGGAEAAEIDRQGFSQWWLVGSLIGYYTLFAIDMHVLGGLAPAAQLPVQPPQPAQAEPAESSAEAANAAAEKKEQALKQVKAGKAE
jgi:hypothetical protein